MRTYTKQECEEWLSARQRCLPDKVESPVFTASFPPKGYQYHPYAHWIATSLTFRDPSLLWITEWGIWPSSENWQLYYRLRESYGDHRFLHEAPGHLFQAYETEELATFLQIAMLNGWGGYVLTESNFVNVFFSHDEWMTFHAKTEGDLSPVRKFYEADPRESGK